MTCVTVKLYTMFGFTHMPYMLKISLREGTLDYKLHWYPKAFYLRYKNVSIIILNGRICNFVYLNWECLSISIEFPILDAINFWTILLLLVLEILHQFIYFHFYLSGLRDLSEHTHVLTIRISREGTFQLL